MRQTFERCSGDVGLRVERNVFIMIKTKKLVAAMSAIALACSTIGSFSASADTTRVQARQDPNLYKTAWRRTAYYTNDASGDLEGIMTFGYNTTLINEDYTWAEGKNCSVKAGQRRMYSGGNDAETGYTWTDFKKAGKVAKIERTHKCNWNRYAIRFSVTFPNLSVNVDNTDPLSVTPPVEIATAITSTEVE